ncbi:MAG: carbohydrate kinase [Verrucomicrobiota bacterium]
MEKPLIIGLGEVLWDCLPSGRVPGGASLNFAWHANQLGGQGAVITALGDDELGREMRAFIASGGVRTDGIQTSALPTSTVEVTLEHGQPSYVIHNHVAWDDLRWTPAVADLVAEAAAVNFGTLGPREPTSRDATRRAIEHARAHRTKLVFDLNLRPTRAPEDFIQWALGRADLLKLNEEEVSLLARQRGLDGNAEEQVPELKSHFPNVDLLAVTLGERGCILARGDECVQMPPEQTVEVEDAVGAGDAFLAALVLGWLRAEPLAAIARRANRVGGYVASQKGAMPVLPAELTEAP